MAHFPLFIVAYDQIGEVIDVNDVESEKDGFRCAQAWIEDLPAVHKVIIWEALKDGKFEQVNALTRQGS